MTRIPDMPDVENLGERSWDRIERGVFDALETERAEGLPPVAFQPPQQRPRWTVAAGALAAAALCAALLMLVLRADDRAGDRPGVAMDESEIDVSRFASGEAPSTVTLVDASMTLAPHSAVTVNRDRGIAVMLERGRVELAVLPRGDRPPLVVQAGDVRVEVLGTRFSVARQGDLAIVEVFEGEVQVLHGASVDRVRAGERWPRGDHHSKASADPRDGARDGIGLSLTRETDGIGLSATGDTRDGIGLSATKDAKDGIGLSVTRETDGIGLSIDDGVATAPAERVQRRPAKPRLTAKERYDRAARLEPTDPEAAAAIYRQLVREGGGWAPPALFAHGRLELDRGNAGAARKLLERYVARYPEGVNAQDARQLLRRLR